MLGGFHFYTFSRKMRMEKQKTKHENRSQYTQSHHQKENTRDRQESDCEAFRA
jgi:hypothetical protein